MTHHLDSSSIYSWMGTTFETICMLHHNQIKKALGISGMATSVSTWRCLPDEKKLRDRMWLFNLKTKNRKPLVHTFVTTFGLGEGKHHSIVHSEVTMDDLFNS